jgi:hypothetical protein
MPTPRVDPTSAARATTAPAERRQPEVRRRLSGPALRAFFNIVQRWRLTVDEQRGLLGWPSPSTFYAWRKGPAGALSFDTLTRISLVLGIYKALHVLYPEDAFADEWIRLSNGNPLFAGRTPLAALVDGDLDQLYAVRRLLDGRRGGWH